MEINGRAACFLCGPRGAGKTFFAKKVMENNPEITYLNQDELFKKKFGKILFSKKENMLQMKNFLLQQISELIQNSRENAKIIIDINTDNPESRKAIILLLRHYGVNFIACWYFITPYEQCLKWFEQKPEDEKLGKWASEVLREYELYHKKATDINFPHHLYYQGKNIPGFDMIRRVDPLNSKFSFP